MRVSQATLDDALVANDIESEDVSENLFSVYPMDMEEDAESEQEVINKEVNDGSATNVS